MGLSPEAVKAMEDAARKLQESIEKFANLAQGFSEGKITENDFNRIQASIEAAVKSEANSTDTNSQQAVVDAINAAFGSLDTVAKNIVESKTTPSEVFVSGTIDLTDTAKQYLDLRMNEFNSKNSSNKEGLPAREMRTGGRT